MLRAVVKGGIKNSKVHFVLDEAAMLGPMKCIDDALDKYRAYGVRLLFFYQSIGQLKKCFKEGQDQTLLSNCTQIYFGANDLETSEMVSKRIGEATIVVKSGSSSRGGSKQYPHLMTAQNLGSSGTSWNESSSWQQVGRSLQKPEEVMQLPERVAITFTPGVPPIMTRLVRYYESEFKKILKQPGQIRSFWRGFKTLAASSALAVFSGVIALGLGAVYREQPQPTPAPFQPPIEPQFIPDFQPGFNQFPLLEEESSWQSRMKPSPATSRNPSNTSIPGQRRRNPQKNQWSNPDPR